MPLNQALVGKAYPAVSYEVGREKLREFAIAVGETDPIYHDEAAARAAGHPDLPAVPTFAVVLSLRAGQVDPRAHARPSRGGAVPRDSRVPRTRQTSSPSSVVTSVSRVSSSWRPLASAAATLPEASSRSPARMGRW